MPEENFPKLIGQGKATKVYQISPDRVLKIARRKELDSHEIARKNAFAEFYISQILHLIYPAMIPKTHFIGTGHDQHKRQGTQFIEPDVTSAKIATSVINSDFPPSFEETLVKQISRVNNSQDIKNFTQQMKELGIYIDDTPQNFVYSEKSQSFYYVDRIKITPKMKLEEIEKLIKTNLAGKDQQRGLKMLARLRVSLEGGLGL